MIGAVLVGTEYFGASAATAMLASYDHAAFTADLQAQGLQNLYWTFSTDMTNPSAGAPSPQTVEAGITGYSMHGITLDQLLAMYVYLASNTFSATVSCGLNNGAGVQAGSIYAGPIVSGCSGLPNVGKVGMGLEFDSVDADGPRSSESRNIWACVTISSSARARRLRRLDNTAAATLVIPQVATGVTDFFYKATEGYEDYSEGIDQELFKCGTSTDCRSSRRCGPKCSRRFKTQ